MYAYYGGFGMSPTKLTVGLSDWVSEYEASTLLRALHALYMPSLIEIFWKIPTS